MIGRQHYEHVKWCSRHDGRLLTLAVQATNTIVDNNVRTIFCLTPAYHWLALLLCTYHVQLT